jgi:RNA polymerase sigma factor (sigma-70 family)
VIGAVRLSDEALALRARDGDERAFQTLAGRYDRVIGAALRGPMFGFGMTVDDAYQEALIGLWRACRAHRPDKGRFGPFAATCIRNKIRNARVRAQRPNFRNLTEALSLECPVGDGGVPLADRLPTGTQNDPAAIAELREELRRLVAEDRSGVERALRSGTYIDPRIRTALALIACGKSQRETAKTVRASESTVKRWMGEAA